MEGIFDHNIYGHAVERADMYIKNVRNNKASKTTKGWHLCVECKDGTTSWERLADLKEATQLKFLSMQFQRTCLMLLILCGGPHMYSRSAAGSLII
jgi:hypothetical protein